MCLSLKVLSCLIETRDAYKGKVNPDTWFARWLSTEKQFPGRGRGHWTAKMMVVSLLAGLATAQAATGIDQKSGVAVSPVGKTVLQGTVTGGGTADVTVFWGPADGGTTPANWAHKQVLKDVKSDTPFSITAEPLVFGVTYHYRCQVSSGGNEVWAPAATPFTGAKPRMAATGANKGAILPVTSSLVCWYDAAVGVTANAQGAVEMWKDLSGNEHHGLPCIGTPILAANQINGKPAVQFRTAAGQCALNCDGPFFSASQYVVVLSPVAAWSNDGSFLGRRWSRGSSHRLSKGTTAFCDQFPTAVSKNGKPITEGPFNLAPITDFMILKIDANDLDMSRNVYQIGMGDNASCDLDIAEIIAYQSKLSASDDALVGGYLAAKYGISTTYPACADQVTACSLVNAPAAALAPTSATLNTTLNAPASVYEIRAYWGTVDSGTDPALWTHSASLGTFTDVTAKTLSHTATGLKPGTNYYFTFSASNAHDTFWATKVRSFHTLMPNAGAPVSSAEPPVSKGLVCWYDASVGVTANNDGVVHTWNDLSGNAHHATPGVGTVVCAANQIQKKPAMQFRKSWLACAGTFFAKEQYVVIRSPTPQWSSAGSFLGRVKGRASSYNTWRNDSGFWRDRPPLAVSRNGIVLPGMAFDCSPITQYMLLRIVVDDEDTTAASYGIGNNDGMADCGFDVAEILAYQSLLTPEEEAAVGGYLTVKYGLTTAYSAPSKAKAPVPAASELAAAKYKGWQHSGSLCILTTPDGADLPATAKESDFPVLVRLDKDWFRFNEAMPKGEDLRFASSTGLPLAYQIDHWDATAGTAAIWVRIPTITGNARQEITLYWGKSDASSESDGAAVFNKSNGYLSAWHMDETLRDEAGTVTVQDAGTTAATGMIGPSRHFSGGRGMNGGGKIRAYPFATTSHTTEAWFKADKFNSSLIRWGRGNVVNLRLLSTPAHFAITNYWGSPIQQSTSLMEKNQWTHVAYTFSLQGWMIYINGRPDMPAVWNNTQEIATPVELQIGDGFTGELDEVRVSSVARSADWMKLQYENQKPVQTVVGPLIQSGKEFAVSEKNISLAEGKTITLTAKAGGARKISWSIVRGGSETLVAVDRFNYTLVAGRVSGDESYILRFKAVFAEGVKNLDIPVTIREDIPDPVYTLKAPTNWDGRETITLQPQITNLPALQAKGGGELTYEWTFPPLLEMKSIEPGKLILKRARNSGTLPITVAVSNGGKPVTQTVQIAVREPAKDAWVQRTPDKDEKPADNQFYARDDTNEGTLHCNGILNDAAESVFLKLYAADKVIKTETQKPGADKSYAFSVKLKPGLIDYKVEFGTKDGSGEKILHTASNLVCGDAYIIDGQSNAVSVDWGQGDDNFTNEWIRSYGYSAPDISKGWGKAVRRGSGCRDIGYWPMDLAARLVDTQKMPICIINGAVGGTLIEAHQRNEAKPTDGDTIYGRLLARTSQARLTHGIRGAFWHQGENDQESQGASGGYGWENYQKHFTNMTANWKQDYPNIQHYYIFQIWPNSCLMGGTKHSDKLRDVQRLLPRLYSNMSIMSTLGIKPEGPCHYPPAGYAVMAQMVAPLVEHYNYGRTFDKSITPPDLQKASYSSAGKDEITLVFDQPIVWDNAQASQFHLDGQDGQVVSGEVSGNVLKLRLKAASEAKEITYVTDKNWDLGKLIIGQNGIAALTFAEVSLNPEGK